jgi:hypothetical protein
MSLRQSHNSLLFARSNLIPATTTAMMMTLKAFFFAPIGLSIRPSSKIF